MARGSRSGDGTVCHSRINETPRLLQYLHLVMGGMERQRRERQWEHGSGDGSAAAAPSICTTRCLGPAPTQTGAGSFKNLLVFQECVKGNIYVEITYNGNNLPVRQPTETVP